jgi:hypothetical protein
MCPTRRARAQRDGQTLPAVQVGMIDNGHNAANV